MATKEKPGEELKTIRQRVTLKLLKAVDDDIEENPTHAKLWASQVVGKLIPQAIEGTGEDGSFVFKVLTFGPGDRLNKYERNKNSNLAAGKPSLAPAPMSKKI